MSANFLKGENMESIIKMSDFHVPFHDLDAINVSLKFAQFIQPKKVILDEVIDFYSISKYNKDPRRKLDLQRDLDISVKILTKIRNTLPNTRLIMVESNHDKRLIKYLDSRAEELSQLRVLNFKSLMHLKELEIEYRENYFYKEFLFKHGSIVKPRSCDTAHAELYKEGVSGISGHTHRVGAAYRTLKGGNYVWLEGGCLCQTKKVEYIDGTADWQQAITMIRFEKNSNHFRSYILNIIDKKIVWGDNIFRA